MEKTFRRYQNDRAARRAFVESEAGAFIAHQIRGIRTQRGWTQQELAKRIGTTQAAISRLEDSSYGRISLKTMVELARAFDVAPVLMFKSTVQLMHERWVINRKSLEVPSFDEEATLVAFQEPARTTAQVAILYQPDDSRFTVSPTVSNTIKVEYRS